MKPPPNPDIPFNRFFDASAAALAASSAALEASEAALAAASSALFTD